MSEIKRYDIYVTGVDPSYTVKESPTGQIYKVSEVETLLKEKETEISILADLVKGRDLTIKQKDEEIEAIKQRVEQKEFQAMRVEMFRMRYVDGQRRKTENELASYRELMGRMAEYYKKWRNDEMSDGSYSANVYNLLLEHKNLEG